MASLNYSFNHSVTHSRHDIADTLVKEIEMKHTYS